MSVFVIDTRHGLVLAVLSEGEAGFGGTAFIKTRPVPIGCRATEDGAIAKVVELCRDAGLRLRQGDVVAFPVDADVTVTPRPWRPAPTGGRRRP